MEEVAARYSKQTRQTEQTNQACDAEVWHCSLECLMLSLRGVRWCRRSRLSGALKCFQVILNLLACSFNRKFNGAAKEPSSIIPLLMFHIAEIKYLDQMALEHNITALEEDGPMH